MQIRNWIIRAGVIAVVALIGDGVAPRPAEARTIAGMTGVTPPATRHCFWVLNGSMMNIGVSGCSNASLDIPLVVDNGGTKNITVTAQGDGPGSTVGCRSEATDFSGDNVWYVYGGNHTYLSMFNTPTDIPINGSYVPGWGSLLVNCQVNYGGQIFAINWNN